MSSALLCRVLAAILQRVTKEGEAGRGGGDTHGEVALCRKAVSSRGLEIHLEVIRVAAVHHQAIGPQHLLARLLLWVLLRR
jgi:hypothetical protein